MRCLFREKSFQSQTSFAHGSVNDAMENIRLLHRARAKIKSHLSALRSHRAWVGNHSTERSSGGCRRESFDSRWTRLVKEDLGIR